MGSAESSEKSGGKTINNNNNNNIVPLSSLEEILAKLERDDDVTVSKLQEQCENLLELMNGLQTSGFRGTEARKRLGVWLKKWKRALNPLELSEDARELISQYHNGDKAAAARYIQLGNDLMAEEGGKAYTRVFGILEAKFSLITKNDVGGGSSNRSKRAKAASCLFTRHAGLMKIEGAQEDKFGNAEGTEYDLGADGAFDGLQVVILDLYGAGIPGPIKALQEKGFSVSYLNRVPSEAALRAAMETASQVWVIDGAAAKLPEGHLDILVETWKNGMSLYIFGDNAPYFVDCNRLLKKMFGNSDIELNHNHPGGLVVKDFDGKQGFKPHLLTTGLQSLYEGITVSSVIEKNALLHGFQPILYDHDGNLIVVARSAMEGCGSCIIDGAFTKLLDGCGFGNLNAAGSERFVRNCACYLSAIVDGEGGGGAEKESEEKEAVQYELCWDGGLCGTCNITFEKDRNLAILASKTKDDNLTDFALDNALGLGGGQNREAFGKETYSFEVAQMFMNSGKDPFRRVDVDSVLPLVKLNHTSNMKIVGDLLCSVLMQGKQFHQKAFFVFLAVCDKNLLLNASNEEVWRFFEKEILDNCVSTPTFTEVGEPIALLDAMKAFLEVEESALNKSFAFLATMVRVLLRHDGEREQQQYWHLLRHGVIKALVSQFLGLSKARDFAHVQETLDELLYDRCLGVLATRDKTKLQGLRGCMTNENLLREIEPMLGIVGELLTKEEVTMILLCLKELGQGDWSKTPMSLLALLRKKPAFEKVWNNEFQENPQKVASRVLGEFKTADEKHLKVPEFVTPYGPTCFSCTCGLQFGDVETINLESPLEVEKLKQNRNRHFSDCYGTDANGYPTSSSASFSLHRAVQMVMVSDQFRDLKERNTEVEREVLRYLKRFSKGDIHCPQLLEDVQCCIDSYLVVRGKGMQEVKPGQKVQFLDKLRMEVEEHKKKNKKE